MFIDFLLIEVPGRYPKQDKTCNFNNNIVITLSALCQLQVNKTFVKFAQNMNHSYYFLVQVNSINPFSQNGHFHSLLHCDV